MEKQEIINKRWDELTRKGAVLVVEGEKVSGGKPTGRQAIVVGVPKKKPISQLRVQDIIPKSLNGVETDVIEFAQPTLLPNVLAADPVRTSEQRPLFGGISCGAETVTAGTAGGRVWKNGLVYGITNWHVGGGNDVPVGKPMLQPGPYDGGSHPANFAAPITFKPEVTIGGGSSGCNIAGTAVRILNALAAMVGSQTRIPAPVKVKAAENLVDMCLFGPFREDQFSNLIYEIGHVDTRNWCDFKVGDTGIKSGRTSAVNMFDAQYINALIRVGLGGTEWADFNQCVVFGPGAEGGDSGSLILRELDRFVGALLFAGSDQNTIGCAWRNVRAVGGLD